MFYDNFSLTFFIIQHMVHSCTWYKGAFGRRVSVRVWRWSVCGYVFGGGSKYYATVYMYSVSEMWGLLYAFNESFILPLPDSNFNHSLSVTESNGCLAACGVNDVGVCGGVQLAAIATVDQHLPNLFRHGDVGHHHTQLLVIHWTQAWQTGTKYWSETVTVA